MIAVIYLVIVFVIQLIAPKYIGIILAIGNTFIPDASPFVDEVLQWAIVGGKFLLSSD